MVSNKDKTKTIFSTLSLVYRLNFLVSFVPCPYPEHYRNNGSSSQHHISATHSYSHFFPAPAWDFNRLPLPSDTATCSAWETPWAAVSVSAVPQPLHWLQVGNLLYHGCLHKLCSDAWNTSCPSLSSNLGFLGLFLTLPSLPSAAAGFDLFSKSFS